MVVEMPTNSVAATNATICISMINSRTVGRRVDVAVPPLLRLLVGRCCWLLLLPCWTMIMLGYRIMRSEGKWSVRGDTSPNYGVDKSTKTYKLVFKPTISSGVHVAIVNYKVKWFSIFYCGLRLEVIWTEVNSDLIYALGGLALTVCGSWS